MYVKHREDIIIYDNNLGIHMRRFETGVTKLWQKNQNYSIFIEIVQYICNTTFLYRHLMVNRKKKKKRKIQISKYFSGCRCFFMTMYK